MYTSNIKIRAFLNIFFKYVQIQGENIQRIEFIHI